MESYSIKSKRGHLQLKGTLTGVPGDTRERPLLVRESPLLVLFLPS